jgi:hypothetical protein
MKKRERERVEGVLPQCRDLHARLWDEYLDAGAPHGCREEDLAQWLIETGRVSARVERGKRR